MMAIEDSIRGVAVHIIVHKSSADYLRLILRRVIVGIIQLVYCCLGAGTPALQYSGGAVSFNFS